MANSGTAKAQNPNLTNVTPPPAGPPAPFPVPSPLHPAVAAVPPRKEDLLAPPAAWSHGAAQQIAEQTLASAAVMVRAGNAVWRRGDLRRGRSRAAVAGAVVDFSGREEQQGTEGGDAENVTSYHDLDETTNMTGLRDMKGMASAASPVR